MSAPSDAARRAGLQAVAGAAAAALCGPAAWAAGPFLRREFIASSPPTPQVHASTLALLPDGGILAAWFGGTAERAPDVRIWTARRVAGGWEPPRPVADGVQADGTRLPTWNPVLFQAGADLLLFYKVGPSPALWWGELVMSGDGGRTWSPPRRLPRGVLGPTRSKPLRLADGTLLCPSSTEDDDGGGWHIRFERTPDLGRTWTVGAPVADPRGLGLIQPTLARRPDGRLLAFARSRSDRIAVTHSDDDGLTWSPAAPTALPNPNAGIEALGLADGRLLMVYNPRTRGPHWWDGRDRLDVAVSADGGQGWRRLATLEDERGAEFSYPAAVQAPDGIVHISYTWKRRRIRYVRLDPGRLP